MKDVDCPGNESTGSVHTMVVRPAPTHAEARTGRSRQQSGVTRGQTCTSPIADRFIPGSLPWLVAQLEPGQALLKADAGASARRACLRAIDAVTLRDLLRKHDLSLWYAVHHSGLGESFRMLKLLRRA